MTSSRCHILLKVGLLFESMFKNKYYGRNNIAGLNVKKLRSLQNPAWSQNDLAQKLQTIGHDVEKNAIQEMESGIRNVTDIELKALSKIFNVSVEILLDESIYLNKKEYDEEDSYNSVADDSD